MAKFLTTKGIAHHLEDLIKQSEVHLFLVSPFLQIKGALKEHIEEKNRRGLDIVVIYRAAELKNGDSEWLNSMDCVRKISRQYLHAKCYLNEKQAILASMNLYAFSEINNDEMGILVSRDEDASLYREIFEEVKRLARSSEDISANFGKGSPLNLSIPDSKKPSGAMNGKKMPLAVPTTGVCIRCGNELVVDTTKPYCESCYSTWRRYKNRDYEENYCHVCGNESRSTLNKPLCPSCSKAYGECNFELSRSR